MEHAAASGFLPPHEIPLPGCGSRVLLYRPLRECRSTLHCIAPSLREEATAEAGQCPQPLLTLLCLPTRRWQTSPCLCAPGSLLAFRPIGFCSALPWCALGRKPLCTPGTRRQGQAARAVRIQQHAQTAPGLSVHSTLEEGAKPTLRTVLPLRAWTRSARKQRGDAERLQWCKERPPRQECTQQHATHAPQCVEVLQGVHLLRVRR